MSEFKAGNWQEKIDVRDFVTRNITPYDGNESFLCKPTERTLHLWKICLDAINEERQNNGVRAIDNEVVSTIVSHGAGYID